MPEARHTSRSHRLAADGWLSAAASAEFLKLQSLFQSLPTPYGLDGAVRFNLLFSDLYPHLTPAERQRAEQWVDTVMANLERQGLADYASSTG